MKFVDGIFPISEFLINHISTRGFKGSYLKIPPLVDYNKFSGFQKNNQLKKYFLYAGDLIYTESITLILNAFENIKNDDFDLYLVLKGSKFDMINMKEKISNHSKKKNIKIFTNLEYKNLLELFSGAKALLIPLNNRIQDVARFPHKIAEYTATGNPIISTNYGEIQHYFEDGVNALIAKKDDALEFSEKMNFVCDYPAMAKKIGLEGYKTGLMYFDSNNYGSSIKHFVKELVEN
jgi:glycosyltransferase involved in cell wall biosynthesis